MTTSMDNAVRQIRLWTSLPFGVLAIGIMVSFILLAVVEDAVDGVAQLRFERMASEGKHVIQTRIDSYGEILYGLAALFTSQESVSRLQFHRYVKSLDLKNRFPGFDVVNYAAHVPHADKKQFEESVRNDTSLNPGGYPSFRIRPPGDRPDYSVLVYVEPMQGFEFAFGLDTGVNPAVRDTHALATAVQTTRDSGKLNSPGLPIRITSKGREYNGLAMRLGVYRSEMPLDTIEQRRAAFFGSVGAGFNIENLMRDVLDEETVRHLRFKLYGAQVATRDSPEYVNKGRWLLYDSERQAHSPAPDRNHSDDPQMVFTSVLPMEVAGRTWEIHFTAPKEAIVGRVDAALPWLVFAGGLLASALLFGMFYSLASSRGRAVELANEMTGDLRASTEQLQALSRRLVDVQETERRQFSRELHDRVGQNLTALSINLDIMKSQVPENGNNALRTRIDDAAALLESTANSIENVMSELRPPMLDDYGLLPALQWYATEFNRRTGIRVRVDGDEQMKRLPQTSEIALFRIAQEALNNVAKHAHASHVEIELARTSAELVMTITDDGVGLGTAPATTAARRRPGLGMVTMRERTQAVDGHFEIGAAPDRGTQVSVRVPG